jgi:hypothetical protein
MWRRERRAARLGAGGVNDVGSGDAWRSMQPHAILGLEDGHGTKMVQSAMFSDRVLDEEEPERKAKERTERLFHLVLSRA